MQATEVRQARQADRTWRKFLKQPAQITDEQARRMTDNFARQIAGSSNTRRLALAVLTRSGRELEQAFGGRAAPDEARAAAEFVASCQSLRDFLRGVADCLETAAMRVEMAMIEREDMEALIREARAGGLEQKTDH